MAFATLVFPLIFIGVFGLAMPNGVQNNATLNIGIINHDLGIPESTIYVNQNGTQLNDYFFSNSFINIVDDVTYDDNTTSIFDVTHYDIANFEDAKSDLQKNSISALLIIPEDFSIGMLAVIRSAFNTDANMTGITNNWLNYPNPTYQTTIQIMGDPTVQDFSIASSILTTIIDSYFNLGADTEGHNVLMNTDIAVDTFSVFDYILPGLIIFGILNNMGSTAAFAMRDVEGGILRRLRITNVSGTEYTLSIILSQLVFAIIQIPIFFGVAILFGFPPTIRIAYAFIFAILVSLSVTGLGLAVAAISKSQDTVNSMATLVSLPMAFLAGSFFMVPDVILINNFFDGNSLGIFDLIAAKPAIEGLRLILIGGQGLGDIAYQLLLLITLTIIYLLLGITLYSRKHLSPED